jgi:hypothetical protein
MFLDLSTTQPVNEQQVRAALNNISLPPFITINDIEQYGYGQIVIDPTRKADPGYKLVEAGYVLSSGVNYVMSYTQVIMTEQEMLADTDIQNSSIVLTQQRLNAFATTRGYDNIASACSYATSTVPKFKSDADYCIAARDTTWTTLFVILNDVANSGTNASTDVVEVLEQLPVLSWPV